MAILSDELQRLKKAKFRKGDNPIGDPDEPNDALDYHAVVIAKELEEEHGLEALQEAFPELAKLLEQDDE